MFSEKVPISLNGFCDHCLTSDISFEFVRECDFITFCHVVRLEFRLRFLRKTYEPRHAIMCPREINYVMRYDVVKSDVIISRRV